MSVQQEKFTEIADAIRAKTGETDLIKPSEFAGKVGDVYEAGKTDMLDILWDGLQNGGNRVLYNLAFISTKNVDKWFYPVRDFNPTTVSQMFRGCTASEPFNLAERLDECGVVFDTSKSTDLTMAFYVFKNLTELPVISFEGMTDTYYTSNIFASCPQLKTIRGIVPAPASATARTQYWDMFNSDNAALENLTILGPIYHNWKFSPCTALTHESLMSIVDNLADKTTDTSGTSHTVTLGATNLTKLNETDIAIATQKNWTLA